MKRRNEFTLIELMVVTSIILIVSGMLCPALVKAQVRAKNGFCKNNLKAIATAFQEYAHDYDGMFPECYNSRVKFGGQSGSMAGYTDEDGFGPDDRLLNAYFGQKKKNGNNGNGNNKIQGLEVFQCPSDRGEGIPTSDVSKTAYEQRGTSYAYNSLGQNPYKELTLEGKRLSSIKQSSFVALAGDHLMHNYIQGGNRMQRWHQPNKVMANLVYVDGHVKYVTVCTGNAGEEYSLSAK